MSELVADIAGFAARYDEKDLNGDVIAPGAFAKSLNARTAPVRMLYQHDPQTPIGRWTGFRETPAGLIAEGEILLASMRAREVHALLSGRAMDGLSIGYRTVRAKKTAASKGRRIIEADLWEVSIVTFPMAGKARLFRVGPPRAPHDARVALPPGAQSPAPPARRASGFPPPDARHFADALREAASQLSV
ncbi:MAG: HK97 family phage prohead protease [Pseudomonadota bacterium]